MLVSALFSLSRTVLSKRPIGLWTRYSKKRLSTLLRSARSAIVPYGTVRARLANTVGRDILGIRSMGKQNRFIFVIVVRQ